MMMGKLKTYFYKTSCGRGKLAILDTKRMTIIRIYYQ